MDAARTKSLIDRAKETSARSYMARFRAQSVAGLAHSLRRAAATLREDDKVRKQRRWVVATLRDQDASG
jgi:hypothetical protein